MEEPFATPMAFVEALQQRRPEARAQLWEWLSAPVERLMRQLAARQQLDVPIDRLTEHALHLAATYLRTRSAHEYSSQSWAAFRASLVLHVGKIALQPFGPLAGASAGPGPLPESETYQNRTLFLPHDRLGNQGFGGDWFGGSTGPDGSLWIMVADVTGHGYQAYLLASALPAVWQKCWASGEVKQPADLLRAIHDQLEDCLPEGVYVEGTLARLGADGAVTVSPAGGTRLLLRRRERVEMLKLRGGWLGLFAPSPAEQHALMLAEGDELLLATDGFFDQLADARETVPVLQQVPAFRLLFDHVRDLLQKVMAAEPQKDDITLVFLRRRAAEQGQPATLAFPSLAGRIGGGDVPM